MASKLTSKLRSRAARVVSRVITAPGAKACGAPSLIFRTWPGARVALVLIPLSWVWSLR
ncbi:hypothetical protein SAMN05216604_1502 [Pseudomonas agarici]|nr:hypothetical protein SAMN05216604_1502 [Pseudomonas agarici]